MRHLLVAVTLLVLALAMPAGAQDDGGVTVTPIERPLNLRSGPGFAYAINGTFPEGAVYPALGRDPSAKWLYVATGPMNAWVASWVVDVTGDIAALPVIEVAPPAAVEAPAAQPEAPAAVAAPVITGSGASFTITDFHYTDDGRVARMWVNVTNYSLTPALSSGNWYPTPNPDGGRQWVTLLKARFITWAGVPVPMASDAPLWEFVVTTDDGLVFSAYAGCDYYDTIIGRGFEPTAQGGFTWEQVLEGGWFSCGGDWGAGNIKPAEDLLPGTSASVPLNIWLVDPRQEGAAAGREIVRLDFIPKRPDGASFGVVDSQAP